MTVIDKLRERHNGGGFWPVVSQCTGRGGEMKARRQDPRFIAQTDFQLD